MDLAVRENKQTNLLVMQQNQTRARKLSLGCTPQTGKVLNYNSSVNNQRAHKTVPTDTRQVRQQKSRETVKKGKK